MLVRVVRLVVVGASVLLALHLFMLAGHGSAGHAPMAVSGVAADDGMAMSQQPRLTVDHDAAPAVGVDMAAACLAVLAALLLLGNGDRRSIRASRPAASVVASSRRVGSRARPRVRSPVELCISRT